MAVVTGSWVLDILLLTITVALLCHWYISSSYSYFKDRGIPFLQPWPFIGLRESWTKSQRELSIMLYNTFPKERFFGYFQAKTPLLVVKDSDLIHRIMVKDFAHFHDQGFPYSEHDLLSKNLFNLKGESWRALRLKLIPTFTTGKLKNMFSELVRCGDQLNTEVEKCSISGETVDSRLFSQNYTSEVIGSIAFGIDINKNSPQGIEFNKKMQQVFAFSIKTTIAFFLLMTSPKIVNTLKLRMFNEESSNYFVNLVKCTKEYRKKNNIKRNDYFQLLLNIQEAEENGQNTVIDTVLTEPTEEDALINQMDYAPQSSQGEEKVKLLTDECFTAQSFVFFSGGSESVSGTLGFIFYHIAKDSTIQERLVEEVKEALDKHNGWTYQAVKDMAYMDQVIQETQRMYPVVSMLMRECSIPYPIPDSNVVLEKGTRVIIPVAGIQMDPNNYSSPEEFNPDRFSNNNHKPSPKYLPFGDGPRICIAMRFAILEMKVCVAKVLSEYSIHVNSKTKEPFKYEQKSFFPRPIGGIWIDFKKHSLKM